MSAHVANTFWNARVPCSFPACIVMGRIQLSCAEVCTRIELGYGNTTSQSLWAGVAWIAGGNLGIGQYSVL